jgi:RNA polymerase sigma-70 factor (ECF subfamily)
VFPALGVLDTAASPKVPVGSFLERYLSVVVTVPDADVGAAGDEELARRASRGDAVAMAALLERHFDFVHSVCRRVLRDRGAAEDARQEVLARAAAGIRTFDHRSSFRTWIFVIARRVCLNMLRSQVRVPLPASSSGLEPPEVATSSYRNSVEAGVDARIDVDAALGQLPRSRREVVVLRYLCDLSYEEIADVLDIPLNTVRTRLHRGLAELRPLLSQPDDAVSVRA